MGYGSWSVRRLNAVLLFAEAQLTLASYLFWRMLERCVRLSMVDGIYRVLRNQQGRWSSSGGSSRQFQQFIGADLVQLFR